MSLPRIKVSINKRERRSEHAKELPNLQRPSREVSKNKSVWIKIREVQFSELQIYTSRCLLDVSTCKFECPKLNIPKTIHFHLVPTSVPYSVFPISINTYPIANTSNLTLPSQIFLTSSQILSNFPHYFSNLFNYVLLIQSISELRPVLLTGLTTVSYSASSLPAIIIFQQIPLRSGHSPG